MRAVSAVANYTFFVGGGRRGRKQRDGFLNKGRRKFKPDLCNPVGDRRHIRSTRRRPQPAGLYEFAAGFALFGPLAGGRAPFQGISSALVHALT